MADRDDQILTEQFGTAFLTIFAIPSGKSNDVEKINQDWNRYQFKAAQTNSGYLPHSYTPSGIISAFPTHGSAVAGDIFYYCALI